METNEISGSTKNHNDEIISYQPIVKSETTPVEEHSISWRRSEKVFRQLDQYLGVGNTLVTISNENKDDPLTISDAI